MTIFFTRAMPSMYRWAPVVLTSLVLAGCGAGAGLSADKQSGFLEGSYSRLQQVESPEDGVNIYRYKNPTFKMSDYKGVMINPVVIYQTATADTADKGITEETIYKVRQEIDSTLTRGASERFNVVTKPGPGIARVSIAITGAEAIGEGFKPRNLMPISAVMKVASEAAGVDSKNAMIVVEAKVQDSVSGQLLGEAVYTVAGESFRLQSSSVEAFQALATKWVKTALREAVEEKARIQ
jgi:hypothetical protein|uniref:DUF3313 domain-containing protein n=1 Tax=Orrella sp. TaxID=1921583 RepID=UPI004048ACD1